MDSIVGKAGAVFPFPDPKPVHFGGKGEYQVDNSSFETISNPYEPQKYLMISRNNGTTSYYNQNNELLWSISFWSAMNESISISDAFFYQEGAKNYALVLSEYNNAYYRVLRIDLENGSVTKSSTTTTNSLFSFFILNGQLCAAAKDVGTFKYTVIDKENLTFTTPQYWPLGAQASMTEGGIIVDGKLAIRSFDISSMYSGNVSGSYADGITGMLYIKTDNVSFNKVLRIPFMSGSIPTFQNGRSVKVISENTVAILERQVMSAYNHGECQKYWDLQSFNTWFSNLVHHYAGIRI